MLSPTLLEQAQALSTEDKLTLLDALWRSIGHSHTDIELTTALDGLMDYQSNPSTVCDSHAVLADLRARYQ